jgi:hypothetical protein
VGKIIPLTTKVLEGKHKGTQRFKYEKHQVIEVK